MDTNTFTTANRKIEQFLFVHDILFSSQRTNEDGLNEWTYTVTPELQRVLAEYREIDARRRERRERAKI